MDARNKRTRLPNKTTRAIDGAPLLLLSLRRARWVSPHVRVVLCSSDLADDYSLEVVARADGCDVHRGNPDDVLRRYADAADRFGMKVFAVTWADEALCDIEYTRAVLAALEHHLADSVGLAGLPEGTYCYLWKSAAVRSVLRSKSNTNTEVWRGYFDRGPFVRVTVEARPRHRRQDPRLTCDYPEDLDLLRALASRPGAEWGGATLDGIIAVINAEPALVSLIRHRQAKHLARIVKQAVTE